tara:strand:+ start:258 stop:410 length:153 start_codon:yes stop_codon:yes gene_type:complete
MAEGIGFGTLMLLVAALILDSHSANYKQDKKFKSHTHASDGSINGIRGWY